MTTVICRSCGEVHKGAFKLSPSELICPCGGHRCLPSELKPRKPLARSDKQGTSPKRRTLRRSQPKRDWSAANAKHEAEGKCRNCGATTNLERAHISGRKFDEPTSPGSRVLYVNPNRIFTLCGPFPEGCHGDYDHKRLDVLGLLTAEEQAQAVLDYGSIESARRRLCPSAYISEREVAG